MTLRLTQSLFAAAAVVAAIAAVGGSTAAQADNSFIVSSQVISDTAVASSSYVGDLAAEQAVGDCADGSCGLGGGLAGAGGHLAGLFGRPGGSVGCQPRKYDRPDLFYNFYSQGNCNQANAQLYVSPLPVPHFVGHTFSTYQPFYPHEYMYWHKNRYHNFYDNGRGMNRTRALYYAPPIRTAAANLYWNKLRLPR